MAVTMLEACALNPPTEAAMAEPTRFLAMLRCTSASTVVLRVFLTTALGMVASATTVLPRPSIQLRAVAFLSVQKFPLTASTSRSGWWSAMRASAFSTPCGG